DGSPSWQQVAAPSGAGIFEDGTAVTESTGGPDADLTVWIDQELCTGDGLCVQYAPEVFEFDVDGLAYVKDAAGSRLAAAGARVGVPADLRLAAVGPAKGG